MMDKMNKVWGGRGGANLFDSPSLKAPRFQNFNLMRIKLAFNLNPGFPSLRHYIKGPNTGDPEKDAILRK